MMCHWQFRRTTGSSTRVSGSATGSATQAVSSSALSNSNCQWQAVPGTVADAAGSST